MKLRPDPRTHQRSPPGASRRGAVFPEAAGGEPDDIGVYGDLDDGLAGAVVWPAGSAAEHVGQGLFPGGGGELAQALPLARDPDAAAEGLVDGLGGGADGGLDILPRVAVQLGEVAALRLEDLGERADVELGGVGAGGRAGPEPVAAADGLVRRQAAGDGPGDAAAGGAAAAGRAQQLAEPAGVAQVEAGVVPAEPGDPGQRLAGRGGEAFQPVLLAAGGVQDDRGGVVQGTGEFQEFQVVPPTGRSSPRSRSADAGRG
jgi:hypothetical protein